MQTVLRGEQARRGACCRVGAVVAVLVCAACAGGGRSTEVSSGPDFGAQCPATFDAEIPWEDHSEVRGPVTFTPSGGTFIDAILVTLGSGEGSVHYTLDGSEPHAQSPVYREPLRISGSTRVRAVVVTDDGAVSGPASASYIRIEPALASFTSPLPLVLIHTFDAGGLNVDSRAPVDASLLVFSPSRGRPARLLGAANVDARIGINVRGNSSRVFAQKSYAIGFHSVADDEAEATPFVGLPAGVDFALIAPGDLDRSLIRNPLAFALSRRVGRYAPRTRQVETFLVDSGGTVQEGHYQGLHAAAELIRRDVSRVNVATLGRSDLSPSTITGGYVFRIDEGETDFFAGGYSFQWVYPRAEQMAVSERQAQRSYLEGYLEQFLQSVRIRDGVHHYSRFIDVGSFIDHNLLIALTKNVDGLRRSAYFHKDRNGPVVAGPVWDFDRSLGTPYDTRAQAYDEWANQDGTHPLEWGWYAELFEDPNFTSAYWQRWDALRCRRLTTEAVTALVMKLAAEVAPVAPRHFARFPTSRPDGTFASEVRLLRSWLYRRMLWLDGHGTGLVHRDVEP